MTTPIFYLPEIAEGQAAKHLTHNEALRLLEIATGVKAQQPPLSTPPASPVEGSLYIVGTGATGVWSGFDKNLALRVNSSWFFVQPSVNITPIYVKSEDKFYHYDGDDWVALSLSGGGGALPSGIAYLNLVQQYTKTQGTITVPLTDAASISVDGSLSNKFSVVLGGNRLLNNPINLKDATYIFTIKQDATGGRNLSYGSSFKFPGGVIPVLSTAPNAIDELYCNSDGNILRCSLNKDYK